MNNFFATNTNSDNNGLNSSLDNVLNLIMTWNKSFKNNVGSICNVQVDDDTNADYVDDGNYVTRTIYSNSATDNNKYVFKYKKDKPQSDLSITFNNNTVYKAQNGKINLNNCDAVDFSDGVKVGPIEYKNDKITFKNGGFELENDGYVVYSDLDYLYINGEKQGTEKCYYVGVVVVNKDDFDKVFVPESEGGYGFGKYEYSPNTGWSDGGWLTNSLGSNYRFRIKFPYIFFMPFRNIETNRYYKESDGGGDGRLVVSGLKINGHRIVHFDCNGVDDSDIPPYFRSKLFASFPSTNKINNSFADTNVKYYLSTSTTTKYTEYNGGFGREKGILIKDSVNTPFFADFAYKGDTLLKTITDSRNYLVVPYKGNNGRILVLCSGIKKADGTFESSCVKIGDVMDRVGIPLVKGHPKRTDIDGWYIGDSTDYVGLRTYKDIIKYKSNNGKNITDEKELKNFYCYADLLTQYDFKVE